MVEDPEVPKPTPTPRKTGITKTQSSGIRRTIPKPIPNPLAINRRPMEAGGPQPALAKFISPKPVKKSRKKKSS